MTEELVVIDQGVAKLIEHHMAGFAVAKAPYDTNYLANAVTLLLNAIGREKLVLKFGEETIKRIDNTLSRTSQYVAGISERTKLLEKMQRYEEKAVREYERKVLKDVVQNLFVKENLIFAFVAFISITNIRNNVIKHDVYNRINPSGISYENRKPFMEQQQRVN